MNTRTCTACGATKPATTDHFYKDGSGLKSHCKPCHKHRTTQRRNGVKPPRTFAGSSRDDPTRTCTKCGATHPNTEEYFYAQGQGNLMPRCKPCTKVDAANYKIRRLERMSPTERWLHLRKKHIRDCYGLDWDTYRQLVKAIPACPCCGVDLVEPVHGDVGNMHVDHCHNHNCPHPLHGPKGVRGLLCKTCNVSLEKPNSSVSQRAYVSNHGDPTVHATLNPAEQYRENGE